MPVFGANGKNHGFIVDLGILREWNLPWLTPFDVPFGQDTHSQNTQS